MGQLDLAHRVSILGALALTQQSYIGHDVDLESEPLDGIPSPLRRDENYGLNGTASQDVVSERREILEFPTEHAPDWLCAQIDFERALTESEVISLNYMPLATICGESLNLHFHRGMPPWRRRLGGLRTFSPPEDSPTSKT